MKHFFLSLLGILIINLSWSQVAKTTQQNPDPNKKLWKTTASCGECNFGLPGDACDLAVMIDGKAYYVDGVSIKEYGHPHAENGFCIAVRKAEVQGEIINNRFKASYFKLLPVENNNPKK